MGRKKDSGLRIPDSVSRRPNQARDQGARLCGEVLRAEGLIARGKLVIQDNIADRLHFPGGAFGDVVEVKFLSLAGSLKSFFTL